MKDLLSAASLLLAVIGVLYGQWYREIVGALDIKIPDLILDRELPRKQVSTVLFGRSIPLALAASAMALIFFPEAFQIIYESIINYQTKGLLAIYDYDAVRTSFVFVEILAIVLAAHIDWLSSCLWRHRVKLGKKE